MKMITMVARPLFLLFLTGAAGLWGPSVRAVPKPTPEIAPENRLVAAQHVLAQADQVITLYVKGLCCPSCAIGIRKKVSVLEFVDTARLDKGVTLDTKTQLATIAVKEEAAVNTPALAQAIRDAGYTPFHLYTLENGKLKTTLVHEE